MATLNEKNYIDDVIRWSADRLLSFKAVVVVAVAALVVGTPLAKRTKSSSVAAKVSGTGNGTISACTLGTLAVAGVYKLVATTTGATALFDVRDPLGRLVGILTVGTAFVSDHINLTVSDGSSDWTAGDVIGATVSGDGKYLPAVYGATDGTGEPCAILAEDVAITTGKNCNVLVRDGIVIPNGITWPASYDSDPKKATAYASLEAARIFVETNEA